MNKQNNNNNNNNDDDDDEIHKIKTTIRQNSINKIIIIKTQIIKHKRRKEGKGGRGGGAGE